MYTLIKNKSSTKTTFFKEVHADDCGLGAFANEHFIFNPFLFNCRYCNEYGCCSLRVRQHLSLYINGANVGNSLKKCIYRITDFNSNFIYNICNNHSCLPVFLLIRNLYLYPSHNWAMAKPIRRCQS